MPESQTREPRLFTRSPAARKRASTQPPRWNFFTTRRLGPSAPRDMPGQLRSRISEHESPIDIAELSQLPPTFARVVGSEESGSFIGSPVYAQTANLKVLPAVYEVYVAPSLLPEQEALARDFEIYAPDLPGALCELYEVQSAARSDGGTVPGGHAVDKAKSILMDMYRISPRLYAVYPMPDGEIAIDAATRYGTSLVVLCNPDGSAQCLTYIGEEYRTKEYPDTGTLPDDFIRKALLDSTPLTDS